MKKINWNEAPHDADFYAHGLFRKENPFDGKNCDIWNKKLGWCRGDYTREKLENFDDYEVRPVTPVESEHIESWFMSYRIDDNDINVVFTKGDIVYFNFVKEPLTQAPPMPNQCWSHTSIKSVHRSHVKIVKKAWVKIEDGRIVERHTIKQDNSYIEMTLVENFVDDES